MYIPDFRISKFLLMYTCILETLIIFLLWQKVGLLKKAVPVLAVIYIASKVPLVIVIFKRFNRRLCLLSAIAVLYSILMLSLTMIILTMYYGLFSFSIPIWFIQYGFFVHLIVYLWQLSNVLLLRAILIYDVTLPSSVSLIEAQQKIDNMANSIPFL